MSPRPAPDLDARRAQVVRAARFLAESEGWPAVTMRRLAGGLGVTQPVLYTVADGRQGLIDAVAVAGFEELADVLERAAPTLEARMRAYLDLARTQPRLYEAMFTLPSGLPFAAEGRPEALHRAFAAIRAVLPDEDDTRAEVAWATLHGLATLGANGRLRVGEEEARLLLARDALLA